MATPGIWISRVHRWAVRSKDGLAAWSSVVTIISVPTAVIGLIVGLYQVREAFNPPSVELEFRHPSSVAYEVVNPSDRPAEDVLVSFGLGCDELKTYWFYVRHGERHASFSPKRGGSGFTRRISHLASRPVRGPCPR